MGRALRRRVKTNGLDAIEGLSFNYVTARPRSISIVSLAKKAEATLKVKDYLDLDEVDIIIMQLIIDFTEKYLQV